MDQREEGPTKSPLFPACVYGERGEKEEEGASSLSRINEKGEGRPQVAPQEELDEGVRYGSLSISRKRYDYYLYFWSS